MSNALETLKKLYNRFKHGKARLIVLIIVNLVAGFHFLIYPKSINEIVIRGIGCIWFLEGFSYMADLHIKILIEKIQKKQK